MSEGFSGFRRDLIPQVFVVVLIRCAQVNLTGISQVLVHRVSHIHYVPAAGPGKGDLLILGQFVKIIGMIDSHGFRDKPYLPRAPGDQRYVNSHHVG